jgi:hypothetical protein
MRSLKFVPPYNQSSDLATISSLIKMLGTSCTAQVSEEASHPFSDDKSSIVAITSPVVLLINPEPMVPTTMHTPSGFVPHLCKQDEGKVFARALLFSTTLERKTCVFTKRVYLKLH